MPSEFDVNEVIASFLDKKSDDFFGAFGSVFKKGKDQLTLTFKTKYKNYLKKLVERFGKSKNFFIRDNPRPLYDFFESIDISFGDTTIEKAGINDITSISTKSLITGTGGAGKSILLKHFLLDSLKEKYKVPIFLELRNYETEKLNLLSIVIESFEGFNLEFEEEYLEKALEKGHFVFLIDGLDEIIEEDRIKIIAEIEELSNKFNECAFIITSRPDSLLEKLQNFHHFNTNPLTLNQAISLLEKLPADKEIKTKFIIDLKNNLFEKHKSFLSNPLLLSIMLLTYGQSGDIPNKLSIFYNQAYEALYQRHDILKGAYKRKISSELDIVSFEKILAAFCMVTYYDRRFTFSKVEALKDIERAKNLTGFNVNAQNILDDLLLSVCILVKDGMFFTFTHRSFQEYFTAKFISNLNDPEKKIKLLKKLISSVDLIFRLFYEIDSIFYEKNILIPYLKNIFLAIDLKDKINKKVFFSFIKMFSEKFYMDENYHLQMSFKNKIPIASGEVFRLNEYIKLHDILKTISYEQRDIKFSLENQISYKSFFNKTVSQIDYIRKYEELKSEDCFIYTDGIKINDDLFRKIYSDKTSLPFYFINFLKEVYDFLVEKHDKINNDLENLLN